MSEIPRSQQRWRGHIALLLSAVLAVVGISASTAAAQASSPAVTYSDVELFDGLVLSQGSFADAEPELVIPQARPDLPDEVVEVIHNYIESTAPTFMGDFGAAIHSGSPYQIRSAIQQGATLVGEAIQDNYADVSPAAVDWVCSASSGCVSVWYVAVGIAVTILVIDGEEAAPTITELAHEESSFAKDLRFEQWVADLADRFDG